MLTRRSFVQAFTGTGIAATVAEAVPLEEDADQPMTQEEFWRVYSDMLATELVSQSLFEFIGVAIAQSLPRADDLRAKVEYARLSGWTMGPPRG